MSDTISTAAREYATRPADERFPSVESLIAHGLSVRQSAAERKTNLKDLEVVTVDDGLALRTPHEVAPFSHWSFSQACRMVGAPAGYLRDLPPVLAADCLNHGLGASLVGTTANVLISGAGSELPKVRACTTDTYGRLWDFDLYTNIWRQIAAHDTKWSLPPTWSGESAGAYAGDRDSFLVIVNGGSIVTDPSLRGGKSPDQMFRGLLIRNSEVGAASVTIEQILFRFICGNHLLWGAMVDRRYRRRHFGSHVLRDTVREISQVAYRWTNESAARDEAIIRSLIDHEIAHTRDAVIDELRACGATKEQAEAAYDSCERTEAASPRSFWGLAQGLTRLAQTESNGYQSDRYAFDQLAAAVLARGAKLVAA